MYVSVPLNNSPIALLLYFYLFNNYIIAGKVFDNDLDLQCHRDRSLTFEMC